MTYTFMDLSDSAKQFKAAKEYKASRPKEHEGNKKEIAARSNQGKPKMGFVPIYLWGQSLLEQVLHTKVDLKCLEGLARTFEFGATKYPERGNFQRGFPIEDTFDCVMRHTIYSGQDGKKYDEESGVLHLSHVLWNLTVMKLMPENNNTLHENIIPFYRPYNPMLNGNILDLWFALSPISATVSGVSPFYLSRDVDTAILVCIVCIAKITSD